MSIMRTRMGRLAMGLLLAGTLGVSEAWARGPVPFDLRGDTSEGGSNSIGAGVATVTSAEIKGRRVGRGTFDAVLTVGPTVVTNTGSGEPCSSAAGVASVTRSNGDVLSMNTNGLACEMGLVTVGTIITPNTVYNGGVNVDSSGSTGRFGSARGTGAIQINWDGGGDASIAGNGILITP